LVKNERDAPRIDTTHCRGRRGITVNVVKIHVIESQILWLPSCSDVLDGLGYITLPMAIGPVITGRVHWRELITII
jgi:hypothetical protein